MMAWSLSFVGLFAGCCACHLFPRRSQSKPKQGKPLTKKQRDYLQKKKLAKQKAERAERFRYAEYMREKMAEAEAEKEAKKAAKLAAKNKK